MPVYLRDLSVRAVAGLVLIVTSVLVGVLVVVGFIAAILLLVGGFMVFVIGPWDFLVWLLKADWRTTHGEAPLIGVFVCIVGGVLLKITTAIWEPTVETRTWAKKRFEGQSELEKVLATYGDDRTR